MDEALDAIPLGSGMTTDDLILVSVDDHVIEPPDMFDGLLPARFQERAPRVEQHDKGFAWVFGDFVTYTGGLNAVVGRPPEEYGLEPTTYEHMRAGCYDVHERVKEMDANGVLASLNFPTFARFSGQFISQQAKIDPELTLAVVRAYNDWHIDVWAGSYPGRFIPCTIPPLWDPEAMAAEIYRTAEKGSRSVTFSMNPYRLGYPSLHTDHWDPFFAACDDTGTVVNVHIGSASYEPETSPDAPMNVRLNCGGINLLSTAADLIWSPILRKFKNIKFALEEGGIGWIPYFLERADYIYRHHGWTGQEFGGQLPSEVFNEHVITCFIDDAYGVANLDHLNTDMITWECDYPHSDTTWPKSPESLARYVAGVDRTLIDKITHLNAMRLFSADIFSIRPRETCTVGYLRAAAASHDISIVARGTKDGPRRTTVGEFVANRNANAVTASDAGA
jgi:predicted TIM-barrel fold metal-dependent hydrolase